LELAARIKAEDEAWGDGLADMYIGCALRIDFIVALTFELDLWEWTTKEVVAHFIMPITEDHQFCRFADHPLAKKYKGKADVAISHFTDNNWGDLVAAAAQGAPMNRFVWIDVFAFRSKRQTGIFATIFSTITANINSVFVTNPVPCGEISEKYSANVSDLNPSNLKAVLRRLTTSRLICIGKFILFMLFYFNKCVDIPLCLIS